MEKSNKLSSNETGLYDEGCRIRDELVELVEAWPINFLKFRKSLKDHSDYKHRVEEKLYEAKRWLNAIGVKLLPQSLYDKSVLVRAIHRLEYITMQQSFTMIRTTNQDIKDLMNEALSLIKSIPTSPNPPPPQIPEKSPHIPRTAFILMWMDPVPERDDVRNAIKEVCNDFGVVALRADEIEHPDRITDVVLQNICESEFLIADLTGARPNVYYEVGYAHALKKRPMLYRKEGTILHFDLLVHNVPEYKDITELKTLLNKRFAAILGHSPRTQFR